MGDTITSSGTSSRLRRLFGGLDPKWRSLVCVRARVGEDLERPRERYLPTPTERSTFLTPAWAASVATRTDADGPSKGAVVPGPALILGRLPLESIEAPEVAAQLVHRVHEKRLARDR